MEFTLVGSSSSLHLVAQGPQESPRGKGKEKKREGEERRSGGGN